ncbi:hypothetical protein [Mycolicibacterium aurum]|nr:hypothetical protein [Mycolicibacterium aurum]
MSENVQPPKTCDAGEFSVGEGMDYPSAPLSPVAKMLRGEAGERVG